SGALVSIDERVIPNNVKQAGSRHLKNIGMQELAAETNWRLGQGGLQKPQVANTRHPTVACDLIRVDFQDFRQLQEDRSHSSVRQPLQCTAVPTIGFAQGRLELDPALSITCRRDNEHVAIRGYLKRRFWFDFEQIQNGLVDDQRVTVSVFR